MSFTLANYSFSLTDLGKEGNVERERERKSLYRGK